jgi:hypothetical protein
MQPLKMLPVPDINERMKKPCACRAILKFIGWIVGLALAVFSAGMVWHILYWLWRAGWELFNH